METNRRGTADPCPCYKLCTDSTIEFEKVVDLKNAGLVVYRHTVKTEYVNQDKITLATETTEDVFILQNTKDTIITAEDYLPEIEKREITCARCRRIMEHALRLLQKVQAINRKDITVICDKCTLKQQPCNCEKIIKKFIVKQNEVKGNIKNRIKEWLHKIKNTWTDSLVREQEIGKYPKRSQSELRIDQLFRRKSRTERDPDIEELFDDLKRSGLAKSLPIINEESKKQIDFLLDHSQLETLDRPLMRTDISERKPYISDEEQSSFHSTDFDAEKKIKQQTREHFGKGERIFEKTLFPKSRLQNRRYSMDDILLEGSSRLYAHNIEKYGVKDVDDQYIERREQYQKYNRDKTLNENNFQDRERDLRLDRKRTDGPYVTEKDKKSFTQKVINERHLSGKERKLDQREWSGEKKLTYSSLKPNKQNTSAGEKIPNKLLGKSIETSDNIKKTTSGSKILTKPTEKSKFTAEEKKNEGDIKQKYKKDKNIYKPITKSPAIKNSAETSDVIKKTTSGSKKLTKATKKSRVTAEEKNNEGDIKQKYKEDNITDKPITKSSTIQGTRKEFKLTSQANEPTLISKGTKDGKKEPVSDPKELNLASKETKEPKSVQRDTESATGGPKSSRKETKPESKGLQSLQQEPKSAPTETKLTSKKKIETKEHKSEYKNALKAEYDTDQEINQKETKDKTNAKKSDKGLRLRDKEKTINAERAEIQKGKELDKHVKENATKSEKNIEKEERKEQDRNKRENQEREEKSTQKRNEREKELEKKVKDKLDRKERPQESQIRKKNAKDSEDLTRPLNKIKIQQNESNILHTQVKEQPVIKELPESNIHSLLKHDSRKANEENSLKRKIYQSEKEFQSPEKKPKTTVDVKKKFQMLRPSQDDLISNILKLKQEGKTFKGRLSDIMTPFEIESHKTQHKIIKGVKCPMCIDSNIELHYESKKKKSFEVHEIVRGQKIYKLKSQFIEKSIEEEEPLFFQSKYDESTFDNVKVAELAPVDENFIPPQTAESPKTLAEQGVIRYALSDRTFIDKGWTMLPTEKVVRKMNVYRMRPAQPEFDWFKRNKNKGLMLYESGERMAEVEDNGRGRWYYKNGRMALDYYDAEESNAQQRYVIYSNGEPDERGRSRPYTILATFDYLGNGIVFDHSGKIRLKYNQTEGVVLDRNIGPVSHWKWHTLNDPPVLQQVMIDTQLLHKDPAILKMGGKGDSKPIRPDDEEMLAIEFDNFIKEKSKKLSQSFKPFQIKTKALKINEHFSLKILDQATIYLIYRDGKTNLKLNIGMILDHKEIVDTDTAELGEVANNMERYPARSDSLAGLQKSVAYAERFERTRTERERRLHTVKPSDSADKLTAAASRPMRHPLHLARSSCTMTGTTSTCSKYSRKPVSNNVYYDSRLV